MTTKSGPSFLMILLHVFLTCITGGLWFLGIVIWWLLKK